MIGAAIKSSVLEAFRAPERVPKSIGSERVVLRQYRTQDLDEYISLFQGSFKDHLEPWSPPTELDGTEASIRRASREHILAALDKWEDGTDYRFFIILRESGEIAGQIGITQIVRGVSQSTFIGYWVGKPFLNRGIATEAVVLALEFAFEHLKLHRVSLWISPENAPSLRVVEKLRLRKEGTALRALFLGGRWQDTDIFAMTVEEWLERKDALRQTFAK
ncbi:MAG TPA: GNAT family protein [Candidatus Kapabacteria bacterium]|jgi:ribosomal-protein-alanine N-acetyltransferase|nr:GNAT family protein [Candidatus Kapabacteria bacterium]